VVVVRFRDRGAAGRRLADLLATRSSEQVVVLGLPRGGVPVAAEVARALGAPLDVILVRKLGVPFHPEFAMGAIGEGGVRIIDGDVIRSIRVTDEQLARVDEVEREELQRRALRYRGDRPPMSLVGCTALIVDDGMATGSTVLAAVQVARRMGATSVVVAVPVASPQAVAELRRLVDEVVCLHAPEDFQAVGRWYDDFSETTDDQVVALLDELGPASRSVRHGRSASAAHGAVDREVEIRDGAVTVRGQLTLPERPAGIVLFAHGSGSSRHSPRNRAVAAVLNRAGLGTLLFDLLTHDEARDSSNVFDIGLLARRLLAGTRWVVEEPATRGLEIGYFGASTGAGAALWAAAESPHPIAAVVLRGGRPDLAGARLGSVRAATLLIVGDLDTEVLELNEQAAAQLGCELRLDVVAGAGHLFEEPGALEEVAASAADWFVRHLAGAKVVGEHR
jgi:putative phosphoribosyl transferase